MDIDVLRAVGLVCLTVVGVLTALMGTRGLRVRRRDGRPRSGEHGYSSVVVTVEPTRAAFVLVATLAATLAILWTAR